MRAPNAPRNRERIVGATVVITFVLGIFTIAMSTGVFGSERRKKEKAFNLCKELTGDPGYVSNVLVDVRDDKGKWMPSLRGFDLKPGEVKRYGKSVCNCGNKEIWFRTTLSGSREQRELASIYSQSPWEGRVKPGLCEEIIMIFNGGAMSHDWPETFTIGTYTEANDPVLTDHDSYRVRIVRTAGDLWAKEYGVQLLGSNEIGQWFVTVDSRNQANVTIKNTDTAWYSWRLYVLPDDGGQQCMDWLEADAYEGVVPAGATRDVWISVWPQEGCFGKCHANLKLELNNTYAPEMTFQVMCMVVTDMRQYPTLLKRPAINVGLPNAPIAPSQVKIATPGQPAQPVLDDKKDPKEVSQQSYISDSYQDADGSMRARWELCKARMDYGDSKVVKEFLKNNGKDDIWWEARPVVPPRQIGGQPCFTMQPLSGSLGGGEEAVVSLSFNASGLYDDEYFDDDEGFYGGDDEPAGLSFGSGRFPNLCSWYFVDSNDPGLRGYRHWYLELNPVGMSVANPFVDTAAEQIIVMNTASRPFSWTIAALPDLGPPMRNMEGVMQRSINLIVFEALAGELEPYGTRAVRFQMVPHAAESLASAAGNTGAFMRPRFAFVTSDPHNPSIPFNIHFSQVATPVEREKEEKESWFPSKSDQRKSAVKVTYKGEDGRTVDIAGGAPLVVPIGKEVVITKTITNNEPHSVWWRAYPDTLQVTSNKPRAATPFEVKAGLFEGKEQAQERVEKVLVYPDASSGTIGTKKKQTVRIRVNATAFGAGTEVLACLTLDGNDPALKKFECFDIHIPEPPGVAVRIAEVLTPSRASNAAASSAAASGRLVVALHRRQSASAKLQLLNLNPNSSFTWTATFGPHRFFAGIRWLRLGGDHTGTLAPSGSQELEIRLSAASLDEDKSQSVGVLLLFETSDPAHPKVTLPVSLFVDPAPIYVEPDFYTFPKPQTTRIVNLDNSTWAWRILPAPYLGQSLRGLSLGAASGRAPGGANVALPFRCAGGMAQVTLQLMFEGRPEQDPAAAGASFQIEVPAQMRPGFGRPGMSQASYIKPVMSSRPYAPDAGAMGYRTETLFVDCVDPSKVVKAKVSPEAADDADTPTLVVDKAPAGRRELQGSAPKKEPTAKPAAGSKTPAKPKATPKPATPSPSPTPAPTGPRCEVSYTASGDAGDAARVRRLQPSQSVKIFRKVKNLDDEQEVAWNATATVSGVLDAYSGSAIDLSSPYHASIAARVGFRVSASAAAGVVPPGGEAAVEVTITRDGAAFSTADEKRSLWFHYYFVCFDIASTSPDLVGLDCLYAVPAEQQADPATQTQAAIPVRPVAPPAPAHDIPEFYEEGSATDDRR